MTTITREPAKAREQDSAVRVAAARQLCESILAMHDSDDPTDRAIRTTATHLLRTLGVEL